MTTAIIGTGRIGSAIARQLAAGGETLQLSSAAKESARKLTAEIGGAAVVARQPERCARSRCRRPCAAVFRVAIQLAIARGASVFATGSETGLDVIARLGATPIDYTSTSPESYVQTATGGRGFDVVFDTVGGATLDASFAAVRRYTGRVVSILGWGSHNLAPLSFRGATYSGVFTLHPLLDDEDRAHHGEILREIATLVDAGALTPRVDPTSYTLDQTADAHAAVAGSGRDGKVVITMHPDSRGADSKHDRRRR